MKRFATIAFLLLTAHVASAQLSLPVDFESTTANYGLTDFGGTSSAIVEDPTNAANKVVRTTKGAGAELWAGTTVGGAIGFGTKIPFTASQTKMSVRVWSPDAGIAVRLKVEQAGIPTISVETEAITTVAGGWQTLVFDFATQAPGTAALNLASDYNLASIFFNFGVTGANAGVKTYYWDDMAFGSGSAAQGPSLPLTMENSGIDWAAAITGFDGGDLSRIENPDKSGINTSNHVLRMVKNAGQPWGGSFVTLGPDINLNQSTEFKVKVWSPRADAKLLFKLENRSTAGINFEVNQTIGVANAWTELTYDFSAANRTALYGKVVLIFDLGTMGDGTANFTFYVDDISQTEAPPPPVIPFVLPATFESTDINWTNAFTNFDGGNLTRIVNPDKSGINTSNHVARMVKNAGAPWGGAWFRLTEEIDMSQTMFRAKVWSPRVGATMLLKLENDTNGAINFERNETVTVANQWTELMFDMSGYNRAHTFQKVVIIFDLGTPGDGSSNFTFYVDDITNDPATSIDESVNGPLTLALDANYPNPFNPSTQISYTVPQAGAVRLAVYDLLGREIAVLVDGVTSSGRHTATFDGTQISSGVYLYRLTANGTSVTRKMMLVK